MTTPPSSPIIADSIFFDLTGVNLCTWKPTMKADGSETWLKVVGNKAKGRISKQVFQENKAHQIFRKTNISYPLKVGLAVNSEQRALKIKFYYARLQTISNTYSWRIWELEVQSHAISFRGLPRKLPKQTTTFCHMHRQNNSRGTVKAKFKICLENYFVEAFLCEFQCLKNELFWNIISPFSN